MNSTLIPMLGFAAVIVLIPVSLWLFKRTPLGASLSGTLPGGVVRAVGSLMLSPSHKLQVVEVGTGEGRRWLVLGITANNITVLHTMEPHSEEGDGAAGASAQTASTGATPFEQFLGKLRQNKGDGNVH